MRSALAAALLVLCAQSAACELPGGGKRIDSPRHALLYRTQPARVAVGEHFALELAVCAKDGKPLSGAVAVDAWMPEHRHGMNYRTEVRALGAGRYRAEGFLFHMPGRWEFQFDLGGERLADSVRIE